MPDALSPRQALMLDVIRAHLRDYQCVPTFRELARLLGLRSTNSVNDHLAALEMKGFIERFARVARCYRLTPKAIAAYGGCCPLCGVSTSGGRAA